MSSYTNITNFMSIGQFVAQQKSLVIRLRVALFVLQIAPCQKSYAVIFASWSVRAKMLLP
jgi:hypothetical protein